MANFCPACGRPVDQTARFCNNCGARLNSAGPAGQEEPAQTARGMKSPVLAVLCSFFIPGLGQVYDGELARGIAIFLGTLIGFFIFIIPGLIFWIFGMKDASSLANRMNKREIPFKPASAAQMVIFSIAAVLIIVFIISTILNAFSSVLDTGLLQTQAFSPP